MLKTCPAPDLLRRLLADQLDRRLEDSLGDHIEACGLCQEALERLTEAAFGQRRKMLRQSLKSVPGALDALKLLGIDPERRAETVSVDEFVALAKLLG